MKPILHVDIFKDKWHIIWLAGIVLHKLAVSQNDINHYVKIYGLSHIYFRQFINTKKYIMLIDKSFMLFK